MLSDHAFLTVNIFIREEFIQDRKCIIIRNSEEEEKFVIKLMNTLGNFDTSNTRQRIS